MDALIHANTCFTLACHSDGLEGVMQVLQQQLHQCISAGDFMALVHLYIGLHRFDECEFILDALADSDQFELILSVSPYQLHFTINAKFQQKSVTRLAETVIEELKQALIAFVSRRYPGATEQHTLISLRFVINRGIGEDRLTEAQKLLARWKPAAPIVHASAPSPGPFPLKQALAITQSLLKPVAVPDVADLFLAMQVCVQLQ